METLWEKLLFWKKPKKTEYRFQYSEFDDSTMVEITSGPYAGVVHSYGMVKLNHETGTPVLQFDYSILKSGQHDKEALKDDKNYVIIIGDILTEIIIENEPIRTNNSEEPDLQ